MLLPNFPNPTGIPIVIELKYNKSDESAIEQIKNRHYIDIIKDYNKMLLVGINLKDKFVYQDKYMWNSIKNT